VGPSGIAGHEPGASVVEVVLVVTVDVVDEVDVLLVDEVVLVLLDVLVVSEVVLETPVDEVVDEDDVLVLVLLVLEVLVLVVDEVVVPPAPSVMVTVPVVSAPRSYSAPLTSVRMTVSSGSDEPSAMGVMVTTAVSLPAAKTTLVLTKA
jgi:hypothetical protein